MLILVWVFVPAPRLVEPAQASRRLSRCALNRYLVAQLPHKGMTRELSLEGVFANVVFLERRSISLSEWREPDALVNLALACVNPVIWKDEVRPDAGSALGILLETILSEKRSIGLSGWGNRGALVTSALVRMNPVTWKDEVRPFYVFGHAFFMETRGSLFHGEKTEKMDGVNVSRFVPPVCDLRYLRGLSSCEFKAIPASHKNDFVFQAGHSQTNANKYFPQPNAGWCRVQPVEPGLCRDNSSPRMVTWLL